MGPASLLYSILSSPPTLAALLFASLLCSYFYAAFISPLKAYSGPKVAAFSHLPMVWHVLRGDAVQWIVAQHQKYGDLIRIGPDELSYAGSEAFKEIHGHKKPGQEHMLKDPALYKNPLAPVPSIINADDVAHARMRRIFSNAFSDRALKLQEPLFLVHIDKLMRVLRSTVRKDPKHVFNMVNMLNFTTFDVMGDLTFGEPLQLLDNDTYHPWLFNIFNQIKFAAIGTALNYYPFIFKALVAILPTLLADAHRKNEKFTNDRVDRRLEKKDARADIWGLILARDQESGLSRAENYSNAQIFMIAGTETTATLMSGMTYYLCTNPEKMRKLTDEIRSTFEDESEITIEKLQSMQYLNACVEEGLRMYPPVPNGLPRRVPPDGVTLNGHKIPPGTRVSVTHLAMYRNKDNFRDPYKFVPERWFSEEYASDKKHALQPFSTGPRNCLGRNMAYHEIRLILGKTLYNFDIHLQPESKHWNEQKIFILWNKPALWCTLTEVKRSPKKEVAA